MPRVRMQNKYWNMVHVAILDEIIKQRRKITKLASVVLGVYNPNKLVAKNVTGSDCFKILKEVTEHFEQLKGRINVSDAELSIAREKMQIINENHNAILDIEADIARYEAIDEKIVEAANKSNGLFEDELGPDYSPPVDFSDDDLLLSVINQID